MKNKFLLVGNGPNRNRGCEAIILGSLEILRNAFGENIEVDVGVYGPKENVTRQLGSNSEGYKSFQLIHYPQRWTPLWWQVQANKRLGMNLPAQQTPLFPYAKQATVALEIGGDNYTMDFHSKPTAFVAMDRFLQERNVPVCIWGASIGPFDKDPEYAKVLFDHMRNLKAIFVRESASFAYLQENSVTENVYKVADPAFLMASSEGIQSRKLPQIPPDTIGLNISPLVGHKVLRISKPLHEMTSSDLKPWLDFSCKLAQAILEEFKRPLLLVPHVGDHLISNDDFRFLQAIEDRLQPQGYEVTCLERGLNARQTKAIISHCAVFAGARMHSTVASLSSHVPTLSLSYSKKAVGLNQDIFGHQDFCLSCSNLEVDDTLQKLQELLDNNNQIRQHLKQIIPRMKEQALSAGYTLADCLSKF